MTVRSRPTRQHALVSSGAFFMPNVFVDDWLPRLRDTEARVLLVVLRQTVGWRIAPGSPAHKRRDWISHSQLMRRTGRGSSAVSAAVAALVQQGLLVVEDAAGRPLFAPEERRRHLGRLYYRISDIRDGVNAGAGASERLWKTGESGGKAMPHTIRQNRERQQTPFTTFRPA